MKNLMKKKIVTGVLMFVLGILAVSVNSMSVEAASAKKNALKAYDQYLQSECTEKDKFAIAYVDNDNVPELLVYHIRDNGSKGVMLYYYKNNKVNARFMKEWEMISGYYKKMNICYEKVKSNESWEVIKKKRNDFAMSYKDEGERWYYVNTKMVSKKKFNAYIKKITKGKKMTKVSYKANTTANRKKVLK